MPTCVHIHVSQLTWGAVGAIELGVGAAIELGAGVAIR